MLSAHVNRCFMVDRLDTAARSALMRSIKASNTSPELFVRQLLHRLGYRFRLHRKDLPGKPDIVLPKHKAVIFVNGCFWHSHLACKAGHVPKSRIEYWGPKLEKTKARDIRNNANLEAAGWRVLVIWECDVKNENNLTEIIESFLCKKIQDRI